MGSELQRRGASDFIPQGADLVELRRASHHCRGCGLYKLATQVVFGKGSTHPRLMLIGEQPGNEEDLRGDPFVGPAGRLLHRALDEARIPLSSVYITNAVKHFKWTARGKSRLSQKPNEREVEACYAWLERELALLKPQAILCLGRTAARSVFGRVLRVQENRRKLFVSPWAPYALVTIHPSALLRIPDSAIRTKAYVDFVADLIFAKEVIGTQLAEAS